MMNSEQAFYAVLVLVFLLLLPFPSASLFERLLTRRSKKLKDVWEACALRWERRCCAVERRHHAYVAWSALHIPSELIRNWKEEYQEMLNEEKEAAEYDRIGYGKEPDWFKDDEDG